ncbi:unnamed protein product, partial [Mesorhabditis belari]|uniref:DOMON domain-containing protein n=1 Tax=Mesorhabditis belari TaxID=2138241 RepID=A0AAF3FH85_9BILA
MSKTHCFPETIPNCPRQCGEARCVCKAGFVRQSNDENKCVPFDFCSAEEEPQCSANATYAKCGTACEPSCENMYDTSPCPASCETPACTCSDNYVRYKGGCIYWGDCPNLEDHLAFDEAQPTAKSEAASAAVTLKTTTTEAPKAESFGKTTPLLKPAQTVCPVNETMTECGQVCEANCVTIFTRTACDKCGDPECACIQGYARSNGVCVYWGDCPRQTQKSTPRFPKTTTIIPAKQAEQKEPKKFVSDDLSTDNEKCYGDWRYPDGCKDCDYKLSWNYVDESDEIEFSLETKAPQNWWTGVGFSPQGSMADADMIIIKSFNGKLSLLDMYSASYSVPTLDASQDAYSETVIGTHANGVLRAQFTRKRNTGDTKGDHIFSDTQCHNFLFPVEGGKLDENGNITIHTATPFVSGDKICVSSCISEEEEKPAKVTDTCETEYRYPPSCVESACDYIARWNYDAQRQDVKFEISSKDLGRWTGIGFSRDGKMANADIYTGWVYEGKAYVTDRYAYGRQLPAIDPADRSDIYEVEGKLFEEMQTISFRRKVVPKDTITDLPLDQCYYFLFPVGGGRVLARKSQDFSNPRTPIGFHDQETPKVSKTKICLCRDGKPLKSSEPHQVRVRRQALQQQQQQQQQSTVSAMACTDMVVGSVFDGRGRVRDMYSPSKASPRMDSFFAGEDDLSGAAAYSEDGVTTIVFRKKLNSNDPADHPILPGPMTVIWAKGADSERYQHTTGGEPIKADPAFFGTDLFKYHGKNRRGVLTIDFFEDSKSSVSKTTVTQAETSTSIRPLPNIPDAPTNEPDGFPSCSGRFSYPRGCEKLDCPYVVEWSSDGVEITFHLEAKVEDRKWTAVGFSRDGGMANSDVVVVSVERGEISVVDQFMPNYGRPAIDEQQDVYDIETAYKSGRVSANFSRRLATKDMNDVSLDECQFFLFTPTGGDLDGNGEILKHQDTPTSSQTKICLSMCNRHTTLSTLAVPVQTKPSPTTQKPKTTTESNDESMEYEDEDESEEKTTQRTTQKVPSTIPGKRLETTRKPAKTLPPIVTQMEDATKRYSLRVRILNREWSPALADPQSEHYRSFTKEVSEAINNLLAKKWQGMRVSKIVDYTKGSVIAEFEVDSNGSPPPMVRELAIYLEGAALRGEIEGFSVEPTTVKVKEMIIPEKPKEEKPMNESIDNLLQGISVDPELLRNVIVISIAALVLLLAVICCCCIMCRIRKTRNNFSPMRSSDSMEAKSYSDIPYKADSYPLPYPASYGPYGTLQPKHPKSQMMNGFENKAFQGPNGTHQRHFSQATTASNKGESSSPAPSGNGHEGMPDGMGETTYHEWYNKVASRPAAQHHEEAMPQLTAPPGAQPNRPPSTQPYVSYPNDPSAFYTLGGEHRQRRNPL